MAGVLIVYVVLLFWIREQRARRRFAGISSYPPMPFIGNIHQIFGDSKGEYMLKIKGVIFYRNKRYLIAVCYGVILSEVIKLKSITRPLIIII